MLRTCATIETTEMIAPAEELIISDIKRTKEMHLPTLIEPVRRVQTTCAFVKLLCYKLSQSHFNAITRITLFRYRNPTGKSPPLKGPTLMHFTLTSLFKDL